MHLLGLTRYFEKPPGSSDEYYSARKIAVFCIFVECIGPLCI